MPEEQPNGIDEQDSKLLLHVLLAVKKGDFSVRLPDDWSGIAGKIADAFNGIVELNQRMTSEFTKISRVVGKEGKITQRISFESGLDSWTDTVAVINAMIGDLVMPTCEMSRILSAVAKGDLTQSVALDVDDKPLKGEFMRTARTINTMVARLNSFTSEVTRVAREVGTEGKLGGQAKAEGLSGSWKDLTDSVNSMASNLTAQVRNIAEVTVAVAGGDLSRKITVDVRGEFLQLKDTINTMVDQLRSFASEVNRVAREVGTEGKLGGQAIVPGVAGVWKELTDNFNLMGSNLTNQVRNIANVTVAVAKGDLTQKITIESMGAFQELKMTINTMVDQLNAFASEVTRVAREVGTDGKLGGQAEVKGVAGTWKDLTDSVNFMAVNLTGQVRNIAEVTTAVAKGDLTRKITVDASGEILELKNTINLMVDQLNSFASEVTRVAREVGSDGKLGGQAEVKGLSGTWKDLTENVNGMANNLTTQVRNIATVTTAVSNGDLTSRITVDAKGEIQELKDTINTMVDQLNVFASEVTRVAREVGAEGKLGGQAEVKGMSGTWKDLTDSVNMLAGNLTSQVRNIALVTTAVANGDLTRKITVDAKGEIMELKETINIMVDQLNSFASEVTRVAREVGSDGKLGGQAAVKDLSGTWKDLTENVNGMANNLTTQVRNIATVTTAVANGDLTSKITVDAKGEILELKNTINIMVDQLNAFASEVTRVAREVGAEGKLGGQAEVKGVSGTWKDLTDSVNMLAGNLTSQVRNIALVTTAVATGDLAKKITVDAKGEILELKNTVNTMVDQLNAFASEVSRVAREVGTYGKLGGQAEVIGVSGTWKDLTENVNGMAENLTAQVRNIALVTTAVANGDLTKKITVDARGEILELKSTVNIMVDQLNSFASEVTRVAREVGSEGKLGGQAIVKEVGGTWKDLTDNVNFMAANLTNQVRNIATVTTAVANGDLTRKITVDAKGEIMEVKETINIMVDKLNSFAAEVTRVAREVGTDGQLGGQAVVRGVAGTWKDLTDNVNLMANNLTDQVRSIAKVVTAVANGDLKQKLTVQAKGEIAALSDTFNNMTDTLATFADQVSGVAREVGVEGRLGGQANVPGAAGTWKDLTDNVNQLAANLTAQVRAITDVATSVTKGDLTRTVKVEARGEVEDLKNNVNEMIRNLKETTQTNYEQDWLKTNLAKFTRMLQGQRELVIVAQMLLSELAPLVRAQHGVFFVAEAPGPERGEPRFRLISTYAYTDRKNLSSVVRLGEGVVGQCAFEKKRIMLNNVPGDYVKISSGLGEAPPLNIIDLPIIFEGEVKAVIELASTEHFTAINQMFLDQLTETIGIVLNTIEANARTEALLKQSQSLAQELQNQQEELQQTNDQLQDKARLLTEQKAEVEHKNLEVEQARLELEDKAAQLTLTSRYKSEFLANMSHELRTPLNSLLILSEQLSKNPDGHLAEKEVEFARTIHESGVDLLNLINDILDLSKIESGKVAAEVGETLFTDIRDRLNKTFQHVANAKGLDFKIELDRGLPRTMETDVARLLQVLKNLLSNAFKFTYKGSVNVKISVAGGGWDPQNVNLSRADLVISFAVVDTGIGVPADKQRLIFEAFQQADGTTSRTYGGTGLGLSISREIATLLGGEISIHSVSGQGSTFTLYLPQLYAPPVGRPISNPVESFDISTSSQFLPEQAPQPEALSTVSLERKIKKYPSPQIDDRENLEQTDRVLLIVEDDVRFALILLNIAREKGFKGVIAQGGDTALSLARELLPDVISLDLVLSDMDGWTVLERLQLDPATRHIPVLIISVKDQRLLGLKRGVLGYLTKPVDNKTLDECFDKLVDYLDRPRRLLVVDNAVEERQSIVEFISSADAVVTAVESAEEGLEQLKKETFDCLVLNLKLPKMSGFELLGELGKIPNLADMRIIVHTCDDLTTKDEAMLAKFSRTFIIRYVKSPERLLDETAFFLHRAVGTQPVERNRRLVHEGDEALADKTVLVVDDDMRNIFALSSVLEQHKLKVLHAENGRDAIDILEKTSGVDLVLMDIMMPEMDGYETTRAIRKIARFKKLPIIALTAKAMKGDRELCIDAGASDYIAKPVDMEQLLSLLRVWLDR